MQGVRNVSLRQISMIPSLSDKFPKIEDITDSLPKGQPWEKLTKRYRVKGKWDEETYHTGLRTPEEIDTLIIHHSGPPEASLEQHAEYHMRKWGAGIAYHLAVDEGRIKQCNDLLSFTYHVGGHNTYTVGILVNADLSQREMTSQERELLYAAILTVKSLLPIKQILGHNELNATACPATSMNRIRQDIKDLEQRLVYENSDEKANAVAAEIANNILWTYNTFLGYDQYGKSTVSDEQKKWARDRLLLLEPALRKHKFIK